MTIQNTAVSTNNVQSTTNDDSAPDSSTRRISPIAVAAATACAYPANTAEHVATLVKQATKRNVDKRKTLATATHSAIDWVTSVIYKDYRLSGDDRRARLAELEAMRPPREEEQYRDQINRAAKRGDRGETDAIRKTFAWCIRTNENDARLDANRRRQIRDFIAGHTATRLSEHLDGTRANTQVAEWLSQNERAALPQRPRTGVPTVTRTTAPIRPITVESVTKDLDQTGDVLDLARKYLCRILIPSNPRINRADLPKIRDAVEGRVRRHFLALASSPLAAIDETVAWVNAQTQHNERPHRHNNMPFRPNGKLPTVETTTTAAPREPQLKVVPTIGIAVIATVDQERVDEIAAAHARGKNGRFLSREARTRMAISQARREANLEAAKAAVAKKKAERIAKAEESARKSRELDLAKLFAREKKPAPKAEKAEENSGNGRQQGGRKNGNGRKGK